MPEVVDLLSSPEPAPARRKITTNKPSTPKKSLFDDSDDDVVVTKDSFSSSNPTPKPTTKPAIEPSKGAKESVSIPDTLSLPKPRTSSKRVSDSPIRPDPARSSPKRSRSSKSAVVLDDDDDVMEVSSTWKKPTTATWKGRFDSDKGDFDLEAFLAKNTYTRPPPHSPKITGSQRKTAHTPEKPKKTKPLSPKPTNVDTTPPRKDRTRELLDRLLKGDGEDDSNGVDVEMKSPTRTPKGRKPAQSRKTTNTLEDDRDFDSVSSPKKAATRRGKLSDEEKAEKAAEKAREKEAKEAEKARQATIKKAEREAAAALKASNAALRNANKIRKVAETLPEMIVDMQPGFDETPAGILLCKEFLPAQPCTFTTTNTPSVHLPVGHLITFRRKLTSRFDPESEMFLPIPEEIHSERHCLIHLHALEFLEMAMQEYHGGLSSYFKLANSIHPGGSQPIYLIEGLRGLIQKAATKRQRAWKDQARQIMPASDSTTSATRRRKPANSEKERLDAILNELDADVAERALLKLQMLKSNNNPPLYPLIYETKTPVETAEWILVFTKEISKSYYKLVQANNQHTIERGPAKCGTTAKDTFHKMLQEITRVTPGVASGVMSEFGSVRELWLACKDQGEGMVKDVVVDSARNGAGMAGRRIGDVASRRIWKVFMGEDEMEEDV